MNLNIGDKANENYLAKVVRLKETHAHPNAQKLQLTTVDGETVVTSLDAQVGDLYIFAPIGSVLCSEFLSWSNSYEDTSLNKDKAVRGFFNKQGKIRAIRLRSVLSMGYIFPAAELVRFVREVYGKKIVVVEDTYFDFLGDFKFIWKHEPPIKQIQNASGKAKSIKKYESKLVDKQFAFHAKTAHLRRYIEAIKPDDLISVSYKIHGANFCVGNVLVKRKLNWREKIAKKLGVKIQETEYGCLYGSRAVIKNKNFVENESHGFYGEGGDVWKDVAERLFPLLPKGFICYGEVFGYTKTGRPIQKGYSYNCKPNELDFVVFRINYRNSYGDVFELTQPQIVEFCRNIGVKTPRYYFYGKARDCYPEIPVDENWHANLLQRLTDDHLEKDCFMHEPGVIGEGIVLNRCGLSWESWKLKSIKFVESESNLQDKGEFGMDSDIPEENSENSIDNAKE